MASYRIRTTVIFPWFLTLTISVLGLGLVFSHLVPQRPLPISILVLSLVLIANFSQRFTSRCLVEITLSQKTIRIKWLKRCFLNRNPDIEYNLTDIESYRYLPYNNFETFRLNLKDGTRFEIWHTTYFSHDDFERLVLEFPAFAEKGVISSAYPMIVAETQETPVNIRKETVSHQLKDIIMVGALGVAGAIVLVWLLLSGGNAEGRSTLVVFVLATFLFVVVKWIMLRKVRSRRLDQDRAG